MGVGSWSRRLCLLVVVTLTLVVAVPIGLPRPNGPTEFPLAGLWDLLTARPGWAFDRPTGPAQGRGGPVDGPHSVSSDATRAGGGAGKAPGKVKGALEAYTPPKQGNRPEWTTPKSEGYVEGKSKWSAAKSSLYADVYENPDGSFTQRAHQEQVNYVGADKALHPISTRLIQGKDGQFRVTAAPVQVTLLGVDPLGAAALDSQPSLGVTELVSLKLSGGQVFAYGLADARSVQPRVSGGTALYEDILPGTDVEIVALGAGIKETVIVKSRPSANSWVFPLRLKGLTPRMAADGSVELLDAAGKIAATIPRGHMQDSKVQPDGEFTTSNAVRYELITVAGKPALKVIAEQSWLDDPARVYPVRVDPTAQTWDNTGDVYVDGTSVQNINSLGVGCYMASTTCNRRRSFLKFNYFDYAYGAPNNSLAGVHITGATLHLYHTWSEDCNHHQKIAAWRVTQGWSVSSMPNGRYPGASIGDWMGEVLIDNNYPACTNSGGNRTIGDWKHMPISNLHPLREWSRDPNLNYGIALTSQDDNDRWGWKRFTSRDYDPANGNYAPYMDITWEYNSAPKVLGQYPPHGNSSATLTPELMTEATDPDNWPYGMTYQFLVFDPASSTPSTPIADSGWSSSRNYIVPAGKLQWSKTYSWTVLISDGKDVSNTQTMNMLSTAVPAAPITSSLSQNADKGFAPGVGNYTTSAVDAQISTVGPALSMARSYNSRDPRTGSAFGAGWSSALDSRATELVDPGSSIPRAVIVTYPTGQDVAFGRNSDGTFMPPSGRFSTFRAVTGGYELVDKEGTKYSFTVAKSTGVYGLTAVTDAVGRTLTYDYASGKVTSITSASGRKLLVAWTADNRVERVYTEQATPGDASTHNTWVYGYASGLLTSVCGPATGCQRYDYGSNSLYPTTVLDGGPHTYLRLNEAAGAATARSSVVDNADTATGVYHNISLGQPGPLVSGGGWTAPTAAGFNGSSSYIDFSQSKVAMKAAVQSVSMWFKTANNSGVLLSYQADSLSVGTTQQNYTPVLYIGTSGKLRGKFWDSTTEAFETASPVNDNQWHHVVLSASGSGQSLYLDGQLVRTINGAVRTISASSTAYQYVGTGFLGGLWVDQPHYNDGTNTGYPTYFNGTIGEFAFYDRALNANQVALMSASGKVTSHPLWKVKRPSGAVTAEVMYDPASGEVTQMTDANNGVWRVNAPEIGGSSAPHTSAVLAGAPKDYFRMVDTRNEINGLTGTFNNVTFGGANSGPLGQTAAAFSGSSVVGSGSSIDTTQSYSVSAWAYLTEKTWNHQIMGVDGQNFSNFIFGYGYHSGDRWRMLLCDRDTSEGLGCHGPTSTTVPELNKWTHLAATVDAGTKTVKLYVNGKLEGTQTVSAALWKANGPLRIGQVKWNGGSGDNWPGRLAEVATYQNVLPEELIKAQFAARDKASDAGAGAGVATKSIRIADPLASPVTIGSFDGTSYKASDGTKVWTGHSNSLHFQSDGNLVLYRKDTGAAVWDSWTWNNPNAVLVLQADGNMVIYKDSSSGTAIWNSGTNGQSGAVATLQPHGVLTIKNGMGAQVWSAGPQLNAPQITTHVYDLATGGRQVRQIDSRGGVTNYGYDTGGFLRATADPNGNLVVDDHDVRGNVIAKTTCQNRAQNKCSTVYTDHYPDATTRVLTPNPLNDAVLRIRDGRSANATENTYKTEYTYDAQGNVTALTDPLGRVTRTDYTNGKTIPVDFTGLNGSGRYVRVYGTKRGYPAGYSLWEFEVLDSAGRNLALHHPTGSSSYEAGSLLSDQANDGDLSTRWSSQYSDPQWIYVDLGSTLPINRVRLTWETAFGENYEIQVSNDAATWTPIKSVVGQSGRPTPAGLKWRTTTASGATEQVTYLVSGDVAEQMDATGLKTVFDYDPLGRIIRKTVKADSGDIVMTMTYDRYGRVATQTEPQVTNRVTGAVHTRVTTIGYDDDGHVTTQTVSDATGGDVPRTTENVYNTLGQLVSTKDALGKVRTFTHDLYGNKITETDPTSAQMAYAYDSAGQLVTTTVKGWTGDPNSPSAATDLVTESRAYDPAGRLASVTDAMGWLTEQKYTDNGLIASVTRRNPSNGQSFVLETNTYDAAGNGTSKATNNGATIVNTIVDPANRPSSETVAGVNRTTSYQYGLDDTLISTKISDGNGQQIVDAFYDRAGRKVAQAISQGGTAGLAGRWKLDQTAGSSVPDAAGNSDGVATGVNWSAGAGVFDSYNKLSAIEMPGPVIDTTQGFTVAAWVTITETPHWRAAVSVDGNWMSNFFLGYDKGADRWRFSMTHGDFDAPTGSTGLSASAPALNTWTHLTGSYDPLAKTLKLYVNGQLQDTKPVARSWKATGPLVIGRAKFQGTLCDYWPGSIKDVQVYQSTLSADHVANIYNGTWPGNVVTQRTSWQLENTGQAKSMRDPNGNVANYEYDALGQQTVSIASAALVEENGGAAAPARATTTIGYNTYGEVVETQDAKNRVTTTVRDATGQAIETRMPSYTPPGSATPINPVSKVVYDDSGQVIESTDPLLRKTSYVYDQLGRLASATAPNGGVTKHTYSLNGEQLSVTDANGARSEATYDYLGRQVTTTAIERSPAATHVTTRGYDSAGRLAAVTPPGRSPMTYEYNTAGEATKVTDGAGDATQFAYDFAGRKTTTVLADQSKQTVSHDAWGRPFQQEQLDPAGQVVTSTTLTHDRGGNVLASTDAMGSVTTFTYNALGAMTQFVEPVSATRSITSSFGYDIAGKPTRFADGRGNKFVTTYNSWDRPESEVEPDGSTFTTAYDAAGQAVTQNASGGVSVTSAYNDLGKLAAQSGTGTDAATANRSFDYDTAGRLTSVTEGSATTNLSYNDRGMLAAASGAAGSSSFTWTPDGRMASRQDAAGTSTYGYDGSGRLSTVADAATGEQMAFAYDSLSLVRSVAYGASGNKRAFTYDDQRRMDSDKLSKPDGSAIGSINYVYDKNGNLTTKNTAGFAGAGDNTYTYDKANRLTSWNTTTYDYDDSGNRTQIGSQVYTYDTRNRLTSDGNAEYLYSPRGTLTGTKVGTVVTPSTFDAYSQQISQGTRTYSYDGLGRVLTASGGVTFAYSGTSNHQASDGTATYSRDPSGELVGVKTGSTGVFTWTDVHDDVVGQFTSTGATLAGSRTFNPLGTVLAVSGLLGNLGYQSGWTDPSTSQVNMHARWYNPATAQFSSRDTARVSPIPSSVKGNRYAYGDGNPLTNSDPTGHWSCGWCNKAKAAVSTAWKATTSAVSTAWNATTSAVSSAYNFVSERVHRGIDLIGDGIKNAKDWTVKQVKTKIQQAKNTYNHVKQKAQQVYNKVQAVAKPYIEAAKKVVEAHVDAVKDAYKATVNWIEEHKAEIAGFVVGAVVGIGCGALIGWTGVGAVACGALAGAVGSMVTGAMKGHTGWQLVGDGLIGGTIGALTGGLGSALSAGIGSGIRGLAGGLGTGLKAFGSAFKAEGANIVSGLAGFGRSAVGGIGRAFSGNAATPFIARDALTSGAKRLADQLARTGKAGLGSGVPTRNLAQASEYLNREIGMIQNTVTGRMRAILGGPDGVTFPSQRALNEASEAIIGHTHPVFSSIADDFSHDTNAIRSGMEVVIDWGNNITHYAKGAIVENPSNPLVNALGFLVGRR